MPESDGSYVLDQQKAAQLDDYCDRKDREFDEGWDGLCLVVSLICCWVTWSKRTGF